MQLNIAPCDVIKLCFCRVCRAFAWRGDQTARLRWRREPPVPVSSSLAVQHRSATIGVCISLDSLYANWSVLQLCCPDRAPHDHVLQPRPPDRLSVRANGGTDPSVSCYIFVRALVCDRAGSFLRFLRCGAMARYKFTPISSFHVSPR